MSNWNPFCNFFMGMQYIYVRSKKRLSRFIDTGYDALRCAAVPHGVNVR